MGRDGVQHDVPSRQLREDGGVVSFENCFIVMALFGTLSDDGDGRGVAGVRDCASVRRSYCGILG